MRRVRGATLRLAPLARRAAWALIVAATALFFARAETRLCVTDSAEANEWYVDLARMLRVGPMFYALVVVVSFPNVYCLDEAPDQPPSTPSRTGG